MPRAHRSYKLSKISFVTFGVRKLLLGNPLHTEANSFKSCKAENANSQCNRIAHALHTKDVCKLLCRAHTLRYIDTVFLGQQNQDNKIDAKFEKNIVHYIEFGCLLLNE